MKYHALFVIFEKAAKFEIVSCCKVAFLWLIFGSGYEFRTYRKHVKSTCMNGFIIRRHV